MFPYLRIALFPRTKCKWVWVALEEGRAVRFSFCNSLCSSHVWPLKCLCGFIDHGGLQGSRRRRVV